MGDALLAAYVLVKWSIEDTGVGAKLRGDDVFWKSLCDTRAFVGDKFMTSMGESDQSKLTGLTVMLFTRYPEKVASAAKYVIKFISILSTIHLML